MIVFQAVPQLKWVLGAYILVIMVGVGGLWQLHDQTVRNCRAIESIKAPQFEEKTDDIQQAKEFLRDSPKGIPGFTREKIVANINRNIRLRARYAPKHCP